MARAGDSAVLQAIADRVTDSERSVRERASAAVSTMARATSDGVSMAMATLVRHLQHSEWATRWAAVDGLCGIAKEIPDAVFHLARLVRDHAAEVHATHKK